jgi:hypothetical protein
MQVLHQRKYGLRFPTGAFSRNLCFSVTPDVLLMASLLR